jgi:hypothetical protein
VLGGFDATAYGDWAKWLTKVPLRDDNLAALEDRPGVKSWRTVRARHLKY